LTLFSSFLYFNLKTMDDKTVEEINKEMDAIVADTCLGNKINHHYDAINKRIAYFNDIIDSLENDESDYYKQIVNLCYEYYRLKDKARN
jgi:hypothetical protein